MGWPPAPAAQGPAGGAGHTRATHETHEHSTGAPRVLPGSSLAKSTFGHPGRGALRSGRGTVFTRLWSCEKRVHLHLLKKLKCPWASASPKEQLYTSCIQCRSLRLHAIAQPLLPAIPLTHVPSARAARRPPEFRLRLFLRHKNELFRGQFVEC